MVKVLLIIISLIALGIGSAILIGNVFWNRSTSKLGDQLTSMSEIFTGAVYSPKMLDGLPLPVQRYFRLVLKEGQPLIRSARIIQAGEFRARKADNGWSRFEAKQYFSAQPPGFVWDAGIRMAPLMEVRVRDMYVAGQGSMQGKILSLVPVVDERGKAELNAGALQRYLAEAVWFPTALLPRESVKWSAIDNNRALATLTDAGTTISLEFHFSDIGEITGVFTPGRYREVNGEYELTPWAGHFCNYEEIDGIRIPVEGEVEWQLPGGSFPYWKGRIVEVEYDFAR